MIKKVIKSQLVDTEPLPDCQLCSHIRYEAISSGGGWLPGAQARRPWKRSNGGVAAGRAGPRTGANLKPVSHANLNWAAALGALGGGAPGRPFQPHPRTSARTFRGSPRPSFSSHGLRKPLR